MRRVLLTLTAAVLGYGGVVAEQRRAGQAAGGRAGDLGWHYHTGDHMLTVDEWKAFLVFMDRYFKN